jgi:hypothetical protein
MSIVRSLALRDRLSGFYAARIAEYGPTPRGVDWNSLEAQNARFVQMLPLFEGRHELGVVIDYGSSYGALFDYLRERGFTFEYWGYDFCEEVVEVGRKRLAHEPSAHFTNDYEELPEGDYSIASGLFNVHLGTPPPDWLTFIHESLDEMWRVSRRGMAFNALTSYSDPVRQRADLYYADPGRLFDHCKRNLSRRVALLHDYDLFDFTMIVRR